MNKQTLLSIGANNLKTLRKINGLTQDEMAAVLKIKRSRLASYEEMRAHIPVTLTMHLCSVFKIRLEDFLVSTIKIKGDTFLCNGQSYEIPKQRHLSDEEINNLLMLKDLFRKIAGENLK